VVRRLAVGVFALLLLPCAGCLWIPDHGYGCPWSRRGEVPATSCAALVPGRATRADVLCELGQPEWIRGDERRLVYWTREITSWMFHYVIADAVTFVWGTDHFLLFEFDERGSLAARREITVSFQGDETNAPKIDFAALFDRDTTTK
jgi:hypothetical protein